MSMQGKVVVVTGSNVGIGLETAVGVAALEATTVLACRNQAKAEAAAKEVTQRTWNDDVHVVPLDLADLASVRKAADEILDPLGPPRRPGQQRRRDVVGAPADGAGLRVHVRRQPSRPLLPDEPAARPVTRRRPVPGHQRDLGRPPCGPARHALRRPPEREAATRAWRRTAAPSWPTSSSPANWRSGSRAAGVTANAVHPGPVRSSFGMDGDLHGFMSFGMRLVRPFEISPKRGAKTSLYLATSPDVADKTGMYWVRSKPGHMSRQARNDEAAAAPVGRERAAARLGRLRCRLDAVAGS